MKKKVLEEIEPLTEIFMDILCGKNKLMVHVHKEDDIMILLNLVTDFELRVIANHLCDVYNEDVFSVLRSFSIPIIYGPLDSFPYKVELKHESWRNVEKLVKSKAKFSLMSEHPVILQRNLFNGLRHLLRFGLSRAEAISKIIKEPAQIIDAKKLGIISPGFTASLTLWNGDPFLMSSYPKIVIAEGKIAHSE